MPSYQRSSVACQNCRLRKVRCSFATSGTPCTNCQYDRVVCNILPRKRNGAKRKHVLRASSALRDAEDELLQHPAPGSARIKEGTMSVRSASMGLRLTSPPPGSDPSPRRDAAPEISTLPLGQLATNDTTASSMAFDANVGQAVGRSRALLYVGDQQAINGMFLDLSDDTRPKPSPCTVLHTSKRLQDPEDLEYLRKKGCFSLPSQSICEELVSRYFQLVHPFIPVINATRFLEDFVDRRDLSANLLVLWSIFFAAASFVDVKTVEKAGYSSRKEMKWAMYRRAKYLFDNDFEEDKVAVVQSAVLLAFFYTDTEDRTTAWQAWQWTGVAISLCQTMGLHRDLETISPKDCFKLDQMRLFRRIWWSCFVRDRWLSLSHGWPMRIQLGHCDTPMPTVEDVTMDLKDLSSPIVEKYLSADQTTLATLWVNLVGLSKALGNTIQTFYSLQKSLPDIEVVKMCENEILQCDTSGVEGDQGDHIAVFHTYDLKLFREAAIIALYRPYIQRKTYQALQPWDQSLQALARTKVKAATAEINVVLERLIDLDEVKSLNPLSLAALLPAIQIHLIESTSSAAPLSRTLSAHKLQLCMMVLSELRDNYWGAAVAYRLFEEAQAKLHDRLYEPYRTKSVASSDSTSDSTCDSTSDNHGIDSTSLPPFTPSSSSLDISQSRFPETQKPVLDDYLFDPGNFFADQFMSNSTFNTDAYIGSDAAAMLGPMCCDYTVDYGLGSPEFEFEN